MRTAVIDAYYDIFSVFKIDDPDAGTERKAPVCCGELAEAEKFSAGCFFAVEFVGVV